MNEPPAGRSGDSRMNVAKSVLRGEEAGTLGGVLGRVVEAAGVAPRKVGLMLFPYLPDRAKRQVVQGTVFPVAAVPGTDSAAARRLLAAVDAAKADGPTPFLLALGDAITKVGPGGTVVAVTDGIDQSALDGPGRDLLDDLTAYRDRVKAVKEAAAKAGVRVFVVGFALAEGGREAGLLAELGGDADGAGGFRYLTAAEGGTLAAALEKAVRPRRWTLRFAGGPWAARELGDGEDAVAGNLPPGDYVAAFPAQADDAAPAGDADVLPFALAAGQSVRLRPDGGGGLEPVPDPADPFREAAPPAGGADGNAPRRLRVDAYRTPAGGDETVTLRVALGGAPGVPDWPGAVAFRAERPVPGDPAAFRSVRSLAANAASDTADPTFDLVIPREPGRPEDGPPHRLVAGRRRGRGAGRRPRPGRDERRRGDRPPRGP